MQILRVTLTGLILLANTSVSLAQGLTIGAVQRQSNPDVFCGVYLPNSKQPMIVADVDGNLENALVNVNGQDTAIKQTSFKWTKRYKRSRAVYKGENLTVIVESQTVGSQPTGDAVVPTKTIDRVTFQRGQQTKVIQTKGLCEV
jgi:hypothetical protein